MNKRDILKKYSAVIVIITMVLSIFPSVSFAQYYSAIITKYLEAMDKNDAVGMDDVVEKNKAAMPAELKALIDSTREPGTAAAVRDEKLFVAESVARVYMELSGDKTYLILAKRAIFESKLSAPVRLEAKDGVHVVDMPQSMDHVKNVFKPDNIIIKKGESVKWVNNDTTPHVFSSMPLIGNKGISTPSIPPGGSFIFKFDKAGDYYYICYIHHAMLGKVTVEGEAEPDIPAEKPQSKTPFADPWKAQPTDNTRSIDRQKDAPGAKEPAAANPAPAQATKDAIGADKDTNVKSGSPVDANVGGVKEAGRESGSDGGSAQGAKSVKKKSVKKPKKKAKEDKAPVHTEHAN